MVDVVECLERDDVRGEKRFNWEGGSLGLCVDVERNTFLARVVSFLTLLSHMLLVAVTASGLELRC